MVPRALLALAAVVPLAAADPAPPPRPVGTPAVTRGVTYASPAGEKLQLDLAAPAAGGPFPAVVLFHGGGWQFGSRDRLRWVIEDVAARGYVAATADYRLAPTHRFPAPLDDVRAAVRFLRTNAKMYNVDPGRVAVGGFSAGGHLALLAALTPPPAGEPGPAAAVTFFAPTDLRLYAVSPEVEDAVMVPFLGKACKTDPDVYRRASPLAFATKAAPPVMLVHGTADALVPIAHSERLAEKLRASGATAELLRVTGAGHGPWDRATGGRPLATAVEFLDRHLKGER